jgi:hypothetical protein
MFGCGGFWGGGGISNENHQINENP